MKNAEKNAKLFLEHQKYINYNKKVAKIKDIKGHTAPETLAMANRRDQQLEIILTS